jgi:hypothetical protein
MEDQDFSWVGPSAKQREPVNDHIADLWTLRGASGRHLTCAAYRVQFGLELRTSYSPDDIVATELFRGVDADERLAAKADAWRLALIGKGFGEIAK